MSKVLGKYRAVTAFLLLLGLWAGAATWCWAEEVLPVRLVALIDRDNQGERIEFPIALHYDRWAAETYLISSTGRITIYDQKYFPLASFGKGRGLTAPSGLAVDRRGSIYVCQEGDGNAAKPRLTIFNQAFFVSKEVVFANIPELADFTARKVAVAESGEIYLAGQIGNAQLGGVVVLNPEGKFLRILVTPENNAWRPLPAEAAVDKAAKELKDSGATPAADGASEAISIPTGLKPKAKAAKKEEAEDQGRMGAAYIEDLKIDRQGRIYLISREVSHIYVLNAKEEYLFKFGEKGGVAGKLSNPMSLAIDAERRTIYVCDYMRHTISCFDYDTGRYVFEFGGRGLAPLWFNFPNNVEVDQRGQVVVSDLFNRRLQVIDPNMEQRRPLAGLLPSQLSPGGKPTKEEVQVAQVLPAPMAAASLGQVAQPAIPVALAALPAPPSPGPATPLSQSAAMAPGVVLPLLLPEAMVGVSGSEQLRLATAALVVPPLRISQSPPRELLPKLLKKIVEAPGPQLRMAAFSPVLAPESFAKPAAIHFASEKVARSRQRLPGDIPGLGLQSFRSLPAALGVYGPVVSLLGVGSWLLSTNR